MNCENCNCEMSDGYKLKIHNVALLSYISLNRNTDEKRLKAFVCPKCGKVELYTE